jgi:hypothetical protein
MTKIDVYHEMKRLIDFVHHIHTPPFFLLTNLLIYELKVKFEIFFALFQDFFVLFNLIIKKVISNTQTKKKITKNV